MLHRHFAPFILLFCLIVLPTYFCPNLAAQQTVSDWIGQLEDADPSKRVAACEALWKIGAPAAEALPTLDKLAESDPSEAVKWMASRAASQIRASLPSTQQNQQPEAPGVAPATPPVSEPLKQQPAVASARPAPAPAPPKVRLGIALGYHQAQGILIADVKPASPADRAGLKAGDVILELGDRTFYGVGATPADVVSYTGSLTPDAPVRLLAQRGDRRFETAVTPETVVQNPQELALAKAAYDDGRKRMQSRDYAGATAFFEQAISHDPSSASLYTALAESYFRRGDSKGELEALKRGVAAASSYHLYCLLGGAYRGAKQFDEAIDAFSKALMVKPPDYKDIALYEQFGFCRMKKRQYREALSLFESAYAINPRSPAAVYFQAGCHDALHDRDQAIRFYRDYLALRHSDNEWNKFAEKRVDSLLKGEEAGSRTADQIIALIDDIARDIISVNRDNPAPSGGPTVSYPPDRGSATSAQGGGWIVGDWDWFDRSIVTIRSDGTFTTTNRLTGAWRLTDSSAARYTLVWSHGYTDTLVLSPDRRRLDGANNTGAKVWGTRRNPVR